MKHQIIKLLDWLLHKAMERKRLPGQACLTCRHFDYCDPDAEPDEVDGYCCHPYHSDPSKSPHHKYGGHWTHSESWCEWWEQKD